jgi:putrescine transport system ATP-binding protein
MCGRLLANSSVACKQGDAVCAALRPEKISIACETPEASHENCTAGDVTEVGYLGDLTLFKVRVQNGFIVKASAANVRRRTERPVAPGDRVWLSWSPDALVVLTR